jgi:hypothetical protein
MQSFCPSSWRTRIQGRCFRFLGYPFRFAQALGPGTNRETIQRTPLPSEGKERSVHGEPPYALHMHWDKEPLERAKGHLSPRGGEGEERSVHGEPFFASRRHWDWEPTGKRSNGPLSDPLPSEGRGKRTVGYRKPFFFSRRHWDREPTEKRSNGPLSLTLSPRRGDGNRHARQRRFMERSFPQDRRVWSCQLVVKVMFVLYV